MAKLWFHLFQAEIAMAFSPEFNTEHEIMCDMEAEINACNRQHFLVLFCSSTDLDLQLLSMNYLLS